MSTKGAVGESFFRVRLVIVLALFGAVAGFAVGNRIEWRSLNVLQMETVHQFEIGALLMKLKSCGIPKAPHWITQHCTTYSELLANPAARDYLIPRMRRALIGWPICVAVGVMLLGMVGLALNSSRFKKLDEHAPRDYFKPRRLVEFLDWFALALIPVAAAAGWLLHNRTVLLASAAPVFALAWLRPWKKNRKLKHVRGAKIEDVEEVERLIRKQYKRQLGGLEIGGVPIPRPFEVLNFLIAGAPGTGKSTAIAPMISAMRERGDRVFCADARGDYLRRFWREGDLILNPLDKRSVAWSPLSEIHAEADAAAISRSLIPDAEGHDASWHRFSQLFLEGVLLHALRQKLANADVARLMLAAPIEELRERLQGTPAAGLLPEKDSQMFHDVRATASPYVRSLSWLAPDAGAQAFSLRRWARDQTQVGACWWNYGDAQVAGLRTLIATQLDLLALGVLEQPDSRERRTWLIIDELHALGRVGTLEEFLARARKAGGCAVLGVQSLVQLRRLYGEHSASAIISCCSSLLALALGDAESQEYVSKLLGEQEQSIITRSSSQSDAAAQQTVQRQLRAERVLMPSELSPGQLKSRHGFLRLPEVPIAPVKLELYDFAEVAPWFMAREVPPAPGSEPALAEASPPAPAVDAGVSEPAPELPPLPADASPAALLDHLEARRQAGWLENQKKDAAGSHKEDGTP
ncbi:MAG: type IV secretion system DNA-binding domain-containing protein [Solirubrobacteraceae bacterium]